MQCHGTREWLKSKDESISNQLKFIEKQRKWNYPIVPEDLCIHTTDYTLVQNLWKNNILDVCLWAWISNRAQSCGGQLFFRHLNPFFYLSLSLDNAQYLVSQEQYRASRDQKKWRLCGSVSPSERTRTCLVTFDQCVTFKAYTYIRP